MTAGAVAAALGGARFDARRDSRHEHLADDGHGRAELAEWERIDQLLPAAAPGTVYAPDSDDVVQAELAATREAELREAARIAARVDEPQALRELGARAAREAAAGLLSPPLLAHAAVLAELAHLAPGAGVGRLAFAAWLVITEPEAAGDLATFLACARA
ncbi:hypothetical protein [Streptomyces sp. NPDC057557]|uniref:hypothetical protein n=1 Tax=Streptomyces sp. NPDC057557 TaxID=3346167 RepID=UPI00367F0F10